jgi:hypothetical protein
MLGHGCFLPVHQPSYYLRLYTTSNDKNKLFNHLDQGRVEHSIYY